MRLRSVAALLGGAILLTGCGKGGPSNRTSGSSGANNGGSGSGGSGGAMGDGGGATIGGSNFTLAFVLPLAGAEPVAPDATVTVTVTAQTAAGADLDQMTLNVDGAQFGTAVHENPGVWQLTLGGAFPIGSHQLQAFGLDLVGRSATAVRDFEIGLPPPMADAGTDAGTTPGLDQVSVDLISPEAGSLVGRAQKIVASGATSNGDPLTYSFLIDHQALTGCDGVATPVCFWDTRSFAGEVLLEVTACDPAAICARASELVRVPTWNCQSVTVPSDAPLLDVGASGQLRILGREPSGGIVPGYGFEELDSIDYGDAGLFFSLVGQASWNFPLSSCSGCYAARPEGAGWVAWGPQGAPFSIAPLDDGGFGGAVLVGFAIDAGPTTCAQLCTSAAGAETTYLGTLTGLGLGSPPSAAALLSGPPGVVRDAIQLLTEPESGGVEAPAALVQQEICTSPPCVFPDLNRVVLAFHGGLLTGTLPSGTLPNAAAHWAVEDSHGVHVAVAMPDGGLEMFESPDAGGEYAATSLYGARVATETGCSSPGCPVYLSLIEDSSETLHLIFPGSIDTHASTSGVALVHGYFAPGAAHWEFEWLGDTFEQTVQAAMYQDAPVALAWNGGSRALLFTFR